jgi:hypothetical protein
MYYATKATKKCFKKINISFPSSTAEKKIFAGSLSNGIIIVARKVLLFEDHFKENEGAF